MPIGAYVAPGTTPSSGRTTPKSGGTIFNPPDRAAPGKVPTKGIGVPYTGPLYDVRKPGSSFTAPALDSQGFLSQLDPITQEAIRAALAAVEAQYGFQRAELEGSQTVYGAEQEDYRQQLALQRERALESVDADANRRGIFRSGIRQSNRAQTQGEFGRQEALAEVQFANSLSTIQRALDALDANETLAALSQVEQILEVQGDADIALGVNGLLVEGEQVVGKITLEDIRAYLASQV